jgi:hypothetical protein
MKTLVEILDWILTIVVGMIFFGGVIYIALT